MNKVSVIIPLYNQAQFVIEAIESVLSQTYKDIEILVVDDGSIDNAKEVLAGYIKEERICYIYQNNRGLCAARNAGIKAAQGKYIKFLDSDDFLYPEQIERQINDIKDNSGVLSVTDHYALRPSGEIIRRCVHIEKEERQLASFMEDNRAVVHSFLTPKYLIEKVGGFDETLTSCEDWDLWVRILRNGAVIKHIPYVGCCYRISTTSMSANSKNMFLQNCKVKEKVNAWLLGENNFSEFLKDVILMSNVKKIEEGISRHMDIKAILPNTLRLTDLFFRSRKKGVFKLIYAILGVEGYVRIRYAIKKIQDSDYEYKLLNETNIYRYGNQLQTYKEISYSAHIMNAGCSLNHKSIILMYHRVTNLEFDPWQLNVTPNFFEEHMRVLKKYGQPVGIQEIIKNRKSFSIGRKEIAVTFDDGYVDNFFNAKPILERYGIPATFFIVSGAVGTNQEFWWDELERIILAPIDLPSSFRMTIAGVEYYWHMISQEDDKLVKEAPPNGIIISRMQLYYALWSVLSQMSFEEKWRYLQQIAIWTNHLTQPRVGNFPMSSQELSIFAQSSLFEIGAHTRCHPMLSKLPREKQLEEISRSKQDLEKILNMSIKTFAYPHGDYSDTTIQLVKGLGFDCACTVDPDPLARNLDVYRLPRFNVMNWDGREFENRIVSWLK